MEYSTEQLEHQRSQSKEIKVPTSEMQSLNVKLTTVLTP